MADYDRHPLDSDGESNIDARSSSDNDDAVFATDEPDTEPPQRPLLKSSLYILAIGFALAFITGVWASNSEPNSTGEIVGSWLQRVGIFVMLAAFCGILFAYRYTYLKELISKGSTARFPNWTGSEWMLLAPAMLGVVCIHWILLYLTQSLLGNYFLLISVAVIMIHANLCVTMLFHCEGIWRGFCIGFVATIALCVMGGGLQYIWSFFLSGFSFRRGNTLPIWPVITFHAFFVLNGFISAAYVWLHGKLKPPSQNQTNV